MSIVEITTREGGDRRAKSYSYRKIADNMYIGRISSIEYKEFKVIYFSSTYLHIFKTLAHFI